MNLLTLFALVSNFLVFWGVSLSILVVFIIDNAHGGAMFLLLLSMAIAAMIISVMPYFIPAIVTVVLGIFVIAHGDGIWLLEFLGTAMLLSALAILHLLGQADFDSLKARYWRHMWTHKSPLEATMGASSPHVTTEMDGNFVTFFLPVLWPFFLYSILTAPKPTPKEVIPYFNPRNIEGRLNVIAEHLEREHGARGATLRGLVSSAEGLSELERATLEKILDLLALQEKDPDGFPKRLHYELSQCVIQQWKEART